MSSGERSIITLDTKSKEYERPMIVPVQVVYESLLLYGPDGRTEKERQLEEDLYYFLDETNSRNFLFPSDVE